MAIHPPGALRQLFPPAGCIAVIMSRQPESSFGGQALLTDIAEVARKTAIELFEKAGLKAGQTVVVGCSTSEIAGAHIGTLSSAEIGAAVFEALSSVFSEVGVFIADQC